MTTTDILQVSNMAIEDFAFSSSFAEIIEIKQDINLACKELEITQPINVYEAKKISHYLKRRDNNE